MEFNFNDINQLKFGNLVQYNGIPYTIYDLDKELVYLDNPDLKPLGIPLFEIKPILLNSHVMNALHFDIIEQPTAITNDNNEIIQTNTKYKLANDVGIDFVVEIIIDYNDQDLTIKSLNNKLENKIKYLHQLQNIFKLVYNFELLQMN